MKISEDQKCKSPLVSPVILEYRLFRQVESVGNVSFLNHVTDHHRYEQLIIQKETYPKVGKTTLKIVRNGSHDFFFKVNFKLTKSYLFFGNGNN